MWNCGPLAKRGERKIAHTSPTGELTYLDADGPMTMLPFVYGKMATLHLDSAYRTIAK
jgi:hypothetical protein